MLEAERSARVDPTPPDNAGRAGRELPYVPALDGVRAIAVAAVLLYHAGVDWFPAGFLGVDVFFVLSGFLITSLLLRERESTGRVDLLRFWIRRARRLLPAAVLVIAVCALVTAIFLPEELQRMRGDALATLAYVNNWHQILAERSYFAAFERPSLLQHFWSLAIEEQFYLLWPLALGFCLSRLGRKRTAIVTLAAALLSALAMGVLFDSGTDPSREYFGTDTHASGLLIGALLAFVWPLGGLRSTPRPGAAILLDGAALAGLGVVLLAMLSWQDYDAWVYRGGLTTVAIASAVMIAAVSHPSCRVAIAFGVAPMRWIGQRSYGIYLWHWPVMALTRPDVDLHWSPWLLIPFQTAITVGIAAASYRWVEQPIRRGHAKAWLDRRAPRRRLAVASAALLGATLLTGWVAFRSIPPLPTVPEEGTRSAAATRTPPKKERPERKAAADRLPPLAVGASVMLAAQPELGRRATVDAAVGRQAKDIIGRLAAYKAAGELPSRVIVQIGENGPVLGEDVRALREVLRGVRRVVIVNPHVPRRWNEESDQLLAETVEGWPEARLADWNEVAGRPGLLYDDLTHPNPQGQRAYARVVQQALAAP
jgi:peptidoglycan/LPS O-acetylase OafA/YrhL